jgi:uncharacterized protein (DUF302 family)
MTPDGMILLPSRHDTKETMEHLAASVAARGMHVFARIDHADAARQAGLTLRPTEVLIFGDPKGGTLLMQAVQSIGIDLPLKVLVWEDESGKCWIGYNDPHWLAARHGVVKGHEKLLDAMTKGLEAVTKEAC